LNTAAGDAGRELRRAVAGGSYLGSCDRAQTSFRHYINPQSRFASVGIRLVGLT